MFGKDFKIDSFKWPWRVEVKVSSFHPWRIYSVSRTLNQACREHDFLKQNGGQVRVRAN